MTRRLTIAAASILLAVWLFGDTYARYFGDARPRGVIRFAHFGGYEDYELWREVIAEFEAAHSDLHVRQEYVVGPGGHYNMKLRQQALAGVLPDVALIQLTPFHDLSDAFADVDELFEGSLEATLGEGLESAAMSAFRKNGVQRGLPISGGPLMIYLNRKCFETAEKLRGRPISPQTLDWTITDFRRLARDLTCDFDGDGRTDQYGFWLPSWVYFQPFLWSFGAALTDDELSEWTLCGDSATKALNFYRDLLLVDRVSPREEDVPQVFQDVGFLTGRAAMCVNGPWLIPFLEKTELRDDYEILPWPIGPAGRFTRMTWDGIVVPKDLPVDHRNAAAAFVNHLLSESTGRRIAQTGRALPALKIARPAFEDATRPRPRAAVLDGLRHARMQPLYPNFGDLDSVMNQLLFRVTQSEPVDIAAELRESANDPRGQRAFSGRSRCSR